ncbi:hypothetical protein [Desulfofustis limnaeus]|nr:hypothetical protein [Desulfofustis limnaeus]
MKRLTLLLFLLVLIPFFGCAKIERLPQREHIASEDIPRLSAENGRLIVFLGEMTIDDLIDYTSPYAGIDGKLFLENEYVDYMSNDEAAVVDVNPGLYTLHWRIYTGNEELDSEHTSVPFEISISAGDIKYIKCNTVVKVGGGPIGALGGVIGGAIAGATSNTFDYMEIESDLDSEEVKSLKIASYVNKTEY